MGTAVPQGDGHPMHHVRRTGGGVPVLRLDRRSHEKVRCGQQRAAHHPPPKEENLFVGAQPAAGMEATAGRANDPGGHCPHCGSDWLARRSTGGAGLDHGATAGGRSHLDTIPGIPLPLPPPQAGVDHGVWPPPPGGGAEAAQLFAQEYGEGENVRDGAD